MTIPAVRCMLLPGEMLNAEPRCTQQKPAIMDLGHPTTRAWKCQQMIHKQRLQLVHLICNDVCTVKPKKGKALARRAVLFQLRNEPACLGDHKYYILHMVFEAQKLLKNLILNKTILHKKEKTTYANQWKTGTEHI